MEKRIEIHTDKKVLLKAFFRHLYGVLITWTGLAFVILVNMVFTSFSEHVALSFVMIIVFAIIVLISTAGYMTIFISLYKVWKQIEKPTVILDKEGIEYTHGKRIAWGNIERMTFQYKRLYLYRKEESDRIPKQIPAFKLGKDPKKYVELIESYWNKSK